MNTEIDKKRSKNYLYKIVTLEIYISIYICLLLRVLDMKL